MRTEKSPLNIGMSAAALGQWSARGGSFAAHAALLVRLPMREKVGLGNLSWGAIGSVTVGMLALQWFVNIHLSLYSLFGGGVLYGDDTSIRNFALVWLVLAAWEHRKRIEEEREGTEPHNHWPGISRLGLSDFLPLTPKVIAVAVEPALGFLAGALMRRLGFSMLGWMIIVASVCFCLSEWQVYQQAKQHRRDMRDIAKEGDWEAELMKDAAEQKKNADHHSGEASALATGVDGLEGSIENRRRERAGHSAADRGAL